MSGSPRVQPRRSRAQIVDDSVTGGNEATLLPGIGLVVLHIWIDAFKADAGSSTTVRFGFDVRCLRISHCEKVGIFAGTTAAARGDVSARCMQAVVCPPFLAGFPMPWISRLSLP